MHSQAVCKRRQPGLTGSCDVFLVHEPWVWRELRLELYVGTIAVISGTDGMGQVFAWNGAYHEVVVSL
jgi:hypothetical protein